MSRPASDSETSRRGSGTGPDAVDGVPVEGRGVASLDLRGHAEAFYCHRGCDDGAVACERLAVLLAVKSIVTAPIRAGTVCTSGPWRAATSTSRPPAGRAVSMARSSKSSCPLARSRRPADIRACRRLGGDHHNGAPIWVFSRHEPGIDVSKWPLVTYVNDVSSAITCSSQIGR
jgi:hypothetical protein